MDSKNPYISTPNKSSPTLAKTMANKKHKKSTGEKEVQRRRSRHNKIKNLKRRVKNFPKDTQAINRLKELNG